MRGGFSPVWLVLSLALAGCGSSDTREWMKIDQSYTTAEFRRDYAECSKRGTLDEDCMKRRGWVAVTAKPEEKPPEPEDPRLRRGR